MIFILSVTFLFVVYGIYLRSYIPNADDLINMSQAPQSLSGVLHLFTTFGSQYRPVTQSLFSIHTSLMPHFYTSFIMNLLLVGVMLTLLIKNLMRVLPVRESLVLGFVTILSPIFFYHMYALSSLNNTLMLIVNLTLLLLVQAGKKYKTDEKRVVWSFLLLLAAICTKESFLLSAFLFCVIAWQNARQRSKYWIGSALLITGMYLWVRFSQAPSSDPNYGFTFSIAKLQENILLLFPWLLNFPRGWQYGAPQVKNTLTYLVSAGTALFFGASMAIAYLRNHRFALFFAIALFFSVAPFLFLNRVLVYYVDSAFMLLILISSFALSRLQTNRRRWIIACFAIISIVHFAIIHPQWQQHSFVARSNETAQNFVQEIRKVNLDAYQNLCILNHGDGKWATQDGNIILYISLSKIHIVSTLETEAPLECAQNSVVIYNNQTTYRIIKQ